MSIGPVAVRARRQMASRPTKEAAFQRATWEDISKWCRTLNGSVAIEYNPRTDAAGKLRSDGRSHPWEVSIIYEPPVGV